MSQHNSQRPASRWSKKPSMGIFALALAFIGIGAAIFLTREDVGSGLMAEADLKMVSGRPKVISVKSRTVRRLQRIEALTYSVGGVEGWISQYHPKYDKVYAAVRRGRPLRMWIDGDNTVYKLQSSSGMVLTYDDTAKERNKTVDAGFAVGLGLMLGGIIIAGVGFLHFQIYACITSEQTQLAV